MPCPGLPVWKDLSAGPKEIYEPANKAIEDAYLKAKSTHANAIFFGSQFETRPGGGGVQLPKGAPNQKYGNFLLQEMRGISAQNRPDIIDFQERVFYEIKTARNASQMPGKVKDQLLDYYRKAEAIRVKFGTSLEPEWSIHNAVWIPPHQLPFSGSMTKRFVCTSSTNYTLWPSGLILYDVREKDEEAEKRVKELLAAVAAQLQVLKNQLDLNESDHRGQINLFNNSFAGFAANSVFNSAPPDIGIWLNAFARILATQRHLREGNGPAAAAELMLARNWFVFALVRYMTWKNGIEHAGRMAQAAIVATAAIIVLAASAAAIATAMGAGAVAVGEAGVVSTGASAAADAAQGGQLMLRIADTCKEGLRVVAEEPRFLRVMDEAAHLASEAEHLAEPLKRMTLPSPGH